MDPTVIAVAQLAITIGEPDANRKAAAAAVTEAAAAGARLVVLPELCDSGYVFGDDARRAAAEAGALASPADDSDTLRQWHALAAEHQLVIVGGFCERGPGGRLFNSAAVVDASGTRAVYRKAHLWDKEKLVFTPGDAPPPVVDTAVGRVAVMICYDLEFPEWVRLAAISGADLIAAPVNWPYAARPAGERPAEVVKAQAAAATNGVFVAVADRCQDERGVSWISGSLIAGPDGYPLAGPVLEDRPAVLTATCDLRKARDKSLDGDNDLLADRRPSLYTEPEAGAKDERVVAANAHWAARFIANGTSYSDFQATMARITAWDDWCREWGRTGQYYERLAEDAEQAGRRVTAGEAWRRAALCWHWGKFVFVDDLDQQRAAHDRTVACFRRGAATLSPPAEPVRVPYQDTTLAAYLRVPGTARDQATRGDHDARAGLGEGGTAGHRGVHARPRPGGDRHRRAGPGGGRVRAADRARLRAGGHGGRGLPGGTRRHRPGPDRRLRGEPGRLLRGPGRGLRTENQGRGGAGRAVPVVPGLGHPAAADPGHVPAPLGRHDRSRGPRKTLSTDPGAAAALITTPLLVAAGGRDRLVPTYHAERLAREAPGAELMLDPDGSHGLTNHAFESRSKMADWLAAHL